MHDVNNKGSRYGTSRRRGEAESKISFRKEKVRSREGVAVKVDRALERTAKISTAKKGPAESDVCVAHFFLLQTYKVTVQMGSRGLY
jgi:hypothetical protein